MESNAFPGGPTQNTSDDVATSPQTEGPESKNIPGPSEADTTAAQDPLLHGGRNRSKRRASLPSEGTAKRLKKTKASASKLPTSSLALLIYNAVANTKKKSGLSMQALKKIVENTGYNMAKKKHYFLRSIRNMVAKGQLWQIKGTGATGSFKISPDFRKKKPPTAKKDSKAKHSTKNKKKTAVSKNAGETAKKQVKANVKRSCKRGKVSSVQAASVNV